MNPRGLINETWIVSADDDARVRRLLAMKADEVLAIDREYRTPEADCEGQDFLVFNRLLG